MLKEKLLPYNKMINLVEIHLFRHDENLCSNIILYNNKNVYLYFLFLLF